MSEENEHNYISKSHCPWCKGFGEGIDKHWNWVRTALFKMKGKKELQDTMFIPKLQKIIEDLTPEEVEEFLDNSNEIDDNKLKLWKE